MYRFKVVICYLGYQNHLDTSGQQEHYMIKIMIAKSDRLSIKIILYWREGDNKSQVSPAENILCRLVHLGHFVY